MIHTTYPSITKFQQFVELKDFRPPTKKEYVRYVRKLAEHFACDPLTLAEDQLRQYFLFLRQVKNYSRSPMKAAVVALEHTGMKTEAAPSTPGCASDPVRTRVTTRAKKGVPRRLSRWAEAGLEAGGTRAPFKNPAPPTKTGWGTVAWSPQRGQSNLQGRPTIP